MALKLATKPTINLAINFLSNFVSFNIAFETQHKWLAC